MFSVLLGMHLRVECLGYIVTLVESLKKLPDCFVKQLYQFTFSPTAYELMVSDVSAPVLLLRGEIICKLPEVILRPWSKIFPLLHRI